MVPPAICWTSIGPNVRAGLIEAPVAGATGMIAAKTTRPIATPAKPAGALWWITPKTVNTRMKVPTNSAVKAWPDAHGVGVRRDAEADVAGLLAEHAR